MTSFEIVSSVLGILGFLLAGLTLTIQLVQFRTRLKVKVAGSAFSTMILIVHENDVREACNRRLCTVIAFAIDVTNPSHRPNSVVSFHCECERTVKRIFETTEVLVFEDGNPEITVERVRNQKLNPESVLRFPAATQTNLLDELPVAVPVGEYRRLEVWLELYGPPVPPETVIIGKILLKDAFGREYVGKGPVRYRSYWKYMPPADDLSMIRPAAK
jgi:hypothetical protein